MSDLSLRYTLENYRTKKLEIKEAPEEVLNYSVRNILDFLLQHHSRVLNLHELLFFLVLHQEGWKINALPINREGIGLYILKNLVDEFGIERDALHGRGCPDFVLTRKHEERKEFRFVEVKGSEKVLNKHQIDWAERYSRYDLFVIKGASQEG